MNRNPEVSLAPSIDFPLFTSTMAIHFWALARFRPSRRVMRSPSYSPIFCRCRNGTLVNKPRPSMVLAFTSIGTGHFFVLNVVDCFGDIERIAALIQAGLDEETVRTWEWMGNLSGSCGGGLISPLKRIFIKFRDGMFFLNP